MSEQELINNIFKDILDKYIIIYLNDILVYSNKALEDYIGKIHKIFKYFNKRNLRFKLKKYHFHQKEIEFLKYVIRRDGVYINPQKIILVEK